MGNETLPPLTLVPTRTHPADTPALHLDPDNRRSSQNALNSVEPDVSARASPMTCPTSGMSVHSTGAPRGLADLGLPCDAELMMVAFDAELWIWEARRADTWTFVSLPAEASEDIRDLAGGARRGFGSLRVRVTVGGSTWKTSIFPDSARGSYVLPIKRAVRTAEALQPGDIAPVTVELIDF